MWTCVNCGEAENEDSFNFCYVCGAPGPTARAVSQGAGERPTREVLAAPAEDAQGEPPRAEGQEHGFKLPNALASLGQRFRRAAPTGGEPVISVRVSHEAQEAVELLLQAGRFESQADAAGFLLEEGAKAQAELLNFIRRKLAEIERLQAELRGIGRTGAE